VQPTDVVLGIDEAGRGALVGPLVLAAVAVDRAGFSALRGLELRDSKLLSERRRREASAQVRSIATWIGLEVRSAEVVDRFVRGDRIDHPLSLNVLEQRMAFRLIRRAPTPAETVADGRRLFSPLVPKVPSFVARDHADQEHPVVAAAALLAKCERDRLVDRIDEQCASLCGRLPRRGYPGAETSAWIQRYRSFFGMTPAHVRSSWRQAART
jgi:ribonuclease HII